MVPLHPEVMERAAELCAATRLQTADAIHLTAAMHWGCDALLTNHRAFQLAQAPIEVLTGTGSAAEPTGLTSRRRWQLRLDSFIPSHRRTIHERLQGQSPPRRSHRARWLDQSLCHRDT